jgi:hypothetical protein
MNMQRIRIRAGIARDGVDRTLYHNQFGKCGQASRTRDGMATHGKDETVGFILT